MFFVIFWTALVRYTWLSNSSRFFFRQSVLSDVFGLNGRHHWQLRAAAQRCGAGGCRREATWHSYEYQTESQHHRDHHGPMDHTKTPASARQSPQVRTMPAPLPSAFPPSSASAAWCGQVLWDQAIAAIAAMAAMTSEAGTSFSKILE